PWLRASLDPIYSLRTPVVCGVSSKKVRTNGGLRCLAVIGTRHDTRSADSQPSPAGTQTSCSVVSRRPPLMSQVCARTARVPGNGSSRTRYIATARARHEISVPWRSLDRTCAGTGAVFLYGGVEVTRHTGVAPVPLVQMLEVPLQHPG